MTGAGTIQSWMNKGNNPRPEWLAPHIATGREHNGTFLIRTKCGKEDAQARVLVGHVVFIWRNVAYTRTVDEARSFLADAGHDNELAERGVVTAQPATPKPRIPANIAPARAMKPATKSPPANVGKSHKWPAQVGTPPSLDNRAVGDLLVDDSYQRSIDTRPSQTLIRKIAKGWDWRMCHPLVVSKREDDSHYVIDGQHRLAAAKLRGDIPWLPCVIGRYGSIEDEAAMFVAMNRQRRAMNRLDEFHAAQAGNDPEALAIAALIEGAGFTVSRKTGSGSWVPGEVAFTSAIAKVYRKHGDAIPRRALKMMAEAFPDERLVVGSPVFTALCRLMLAPPAGFDADLLGEGLKKFDMPGWASFLAGTKGSTDRAQALREMLLAACDDVAREEAA